MHLIFTVFFLIQFQSSHIYIYIYIYIYIPNLINNFKFNDNARRVRSRQSSCGHHTTYLIVFSISYPDKVSASVSVITILRKIKTMSLTATSTSPLQLPFTTSNGNYLQRNDFGAVGISRFLSSKTKGSPLIRYSIQYFVLCVLSLSKIDWILRNLWEVVTGFRNLRQITRGSERKT
jgi:hypothetical protein